MAKRLKPSERLLLLAAGVAVGLTALAAYATDWALPWWLLLIIWLALTATGYQTMLRMTADQRITDRDHTPKP